MKKTLQVVAALIWQNDRFLICQRPPQKVRGLFWEFVGGKVEVGETLQQALIRECREELAMELQVGAVFSHTLHEYEDIFVDLTLFNATALNAPTMLEHNAMAWILPQEIDNFNFCPADEPVLKLIRALHQK